MNYRNDAKKFLQCAGKELESDNDSRLKYAALELRMAMEAITYDRALAYKDEFPASEYETWQPRKVMSVLLEIDPMADQNSTLSFGVEEEYGIAAPEMKTLGSEKVLSMKMLRDHYDALGSYLHMPTIKQLQSGKTHDLNKMRLRCEEIVSFVKEVLSSPIFNVTLGNFCIMNCQECGLPIRKRMPHGKTEVYAECYNDSDGKKCPASYTIAEQGSGQVEWRPQQHKIRCGNTDCQHEIMVWHKQIEAGRCWTCPECNGKNIFSLGIRFEPVKICREP